LNTADDKPKYCDMVMKGGITSGVVYPTAICELARQYRFRNIGGASAGAIAAAAAAAAEFGRQNTNPNSFDQFSKLPLEFGQPGFLPGLVTPDGATRPAFNTLLTVLKAESFPGKILAVIFGILRNYWLIALLGGGAGAAVAALIAIGIGGFSSVSGRQRIALIALSLAWIVAGLVLFTGTWVLLWTIGALVKNGFGLSNGLDVKKPGQSPLANWMYSLFNKYACLPEDRPLVFGDLWTGHAIKENEKIDPEAERVINLEVITTNLNHLSPYKVPFEDEIFYFDPDEWALLFPKAVLSWVEKHAPDGRVAKFRNKVLKRLPHPAMLPIVVAARLSLSFPGLISAVPLYSAMDRKEDEKAELETDRCWFSDGGICSNFPIHFFDSPVPKWPTFGINLREVPDHETKLVWLPPKDDERRHFSARVFETSKPPRTQLIEFVAAILSTMLDWRDNLQSRMGGYRNRIVHIGMKRHEGGLNLTMPKELIEGLVDRGTEAGVALREKFDWPYHVWARYRITMDAVERYLAEFAKSYRHPFDEDKRIHGWLTGTAEAKTPAFHWVDDTQKIFAAETTEELATFVEDWKKNGTFTEESPRPQTDLRHQARF